MVVKTSNSRRHRQYDQNAPLWRKRQREQGDGETAGTSAGFTVHGGKASRAGQRDSPIAPARRRGAQVARTKRAKSGKCPSSQGGIRSPDETK